MITTALVDLDGTITDPKPGIVGAFRFALGALELEPELGSLDWVIGPPLRHSFAEAGVPPHRIEDALRLYRQHYGAGGLFNAAVYPGMREALAQIRANGVRLIVATSKLRDFAIRILDHFELSDHFEAIHGALPDSSLDDKGDLIAHIRSQEGVDPGRAVMIGDRMHDIRAAKRHDMQSVGVLWGYGSRHELEGAGADRLCQTPGDLPALLTR